MRKIMKRILFFFMLLTMVHPAVQAATVEDVPETKNAATLAALIERADGQNIKVADAAFVSDTLMILVGSVWNQDAENHGWVAAYDVQQDTLQWLDEESVAETSYTAVIALGDGYALSRTDFEQSDVFFFDAAHQQIGEVHLEGVVYGMAPAPDGGVVGAGEKNGSPWVTHASSENGIAWEHVREDTEQESYYQCVSVVGDGFIAAGEQPRHIDLMDVYDWQGTLTYITPEKEGGEIQLVTGLALENEGTLIACGTNEDHQGKTYGTSSALGITPMILAGPQTLLPSSGYNSLSSLSGQGTLTRAGVIAAGFRVSAENPDTQHALLAALGHDGFPYHIWQFDFGTQSEAIKILEDGRGTYWVVGHGNARVLGSAEDEKVIRGFILRLDARDGIIQDDLNG